MKKINMGCGWRNFGKDWIHIDGGSYEHLDYNNINVLPFEDNSIDLIYASHVIEYFDLIEINTLLKEWNRVLKKGSTLRVAVPDFSVMAQLYVDKKYNLNNFIGPIFGRMKMGEDFIYHKVVYDIDLLTKMLNDNKFVNVKKYDWKLTDHSHFDDHSQAYLPHMDKDNGTLISLNIECIKE